ncbi:MAG TPA: coenzyme F420-0:L-glutamate ligase [Candidatus Binatia bacterium]|jgi:coenzyme F420-0:L-glutamate ligase/coenzyme F420-1:gamma-L-glutamate ligase
MKTVSVIGLEGMPAILPGDDLAALIGDAAVRAGGLAWRDIVVVCQKVVSKSEGRIVRMDSVEPRDKAKAYAKKYEKDPALIELALREATEVLRMNDGHLITATAKGFVAANSGVDRSNQASNDEATLLPLDSDVSAAGLRSRLAARFGFDVAVVITDTFGRPWRLGQIDFAIGTAGLKVLDDHIGRTDWSGRTLEHTIIAVADQVAAAAGLVMAKAGGIPAVLVRGFDYVAGEDDAGALIRPRAQDLFR